MKYITVIAIILATFSMATSVYLYFELRQLKCDVLNGIFAEREYTYPILRDLGYEPSNYGKDILSPITTNETYFSSCGQYRRNK